MFFLFEVDNPESICQGGRLRQDRGNHREVKRDCKLEQPKRFFWDKGLIGNYREVKGNCKLYQKAPYRKIIIIIKNTYTSFARVCGGHREINQD